MQNILLSSFLRMRKWGFRKGLDPEYLTNGRDWGFYSDFLFSKAGFSFDFLTKEAPVEIQAVYISSTHSFNRYFLGLLGLSCLPIMVKFSLHHQRSL